MALTKTQLSLIEKVRSVGSSGQAERLSDGDCRFLIFTIATDLGLLHLFPELQDKDLPPFFASGLSIRPEPDGLGVSVLIERLFDADPDADDFFCCLGALYKARLKYGNILKCQAIPTLDQVGPRGLLQYGTLTPKGLIGFLLWRKWMFDIDNRAGQETGYLFEPIIAAAIGGVPISASKSPVRRQSDSRKGRQIDCLKNGAAYEIKMRVTIAASGQGRWGEELEFPDDCKASGLEPNLVVFDSTDNPKLQELKSRFLKADGKVFIGADAWEHLRQEAGPTMSRFIDLYVRQPIDDLLSNRVASIPDLYLSMSEQEFVMTIGEEEHIVRRGKPCSSDDITPMPEDIND